MRPDSEKSAPQKFSEISDRQRAEDNGFGGDFEPAPVKVTDKRGQPAPPAPSAEGAREGEGTTTPSADVMVPVAQEILAAVDWLRAGDRFWVRGVRYIVARELPEMNGIFVQPIGFDKQTLGRMKKADRNLKAKDAPNRAGRRKK